MSNDHEALAKNLDEFLNNNSGNYLLFSATHYYVSDDLGALGSADVQSVLQKHDYFDIAIEARYEFQEDANELATGKISVDDFAAAAGKAYGELNEEFTSKATEAYKITGEFIQSVSAEPVVDGQGQGFVDSFGESVMAAEQRGMAVHLVERQAPTLEGHIDLLDQAGLNNAGLYLAIYGELDEEHTDLTRLIDEDSIRKQSAAYSAVARESSEVADLENQRIESRISNDDALAKVIKEETGGRKAVVFYGDAHGSMTDSDLDEQLGEDTLRIRLVNNDRDFWRTSQRDYGQGRDMPSAYANVETGAVISGEAAYKGARAYDDKLNRDMDGTESPAVETTAEPKLDTLGR